MLVKLVLVVALASGVVGILDSLFLQLDASCTKPDTFTCRNSKCVPKIKRCDGRPDCLDASDEEDCDVYLCREPNYFKCNNAKCVSTTFRCDDENDCGDYSDEENCTHFKYILAHPKKCAHNEWQCMDHLCIPKDFVCNGKNDCLDSTDETIGCTLHMDCDGFKCTNGHCVPIEWRCDGFNDCHDQSDELDCENYVKPDDCTIENEKYLCANNHTCIDIDNVCDGTAQCPDKSDELDSCSKSKKCPSLSCKYKCYDLPTGATCACPKGFRRYMEDDCKDTNECEEKFAICDQKCKNTMGSYECMCDNKYALQADNRTCKVMGGEALMVFSSKTEIRGYFLDSEVLFPIAQNLKQVIGIDFDGHHMYWTDIFSEHESVVKALEDGSQQEMIVTVGLGAPEDLAVDWVTGNIYFTDSEMQHIGVCSNTGILCAVLVNKDIHKPRGIVLHPTEGMMFWSDWGKQPQIAKSTMDGSNDYPFVTDDIHWPNGLAIDYSNGRLYWTEGKLMTLESIHLDGTDRRIVLEGIVKHPYAIAIFENRLFWSDWGTHSIQSCDKFTGKNHTVHITENREHIYGLHVFHSVLKPTIPNPCANSLCTDMCLIGGPKLYTCVCPLEKVLGNDLHTCKEVTQRPLLAIAAKNVILRLEHQKLGKQVTSALSTIATEIGAITFDPANNIIFVADVSSVKRIISMNLHSEFSEVVMSENLGNVTSMAFDYLGNNLFWCDNEKNTIEVYSLTTKTRKIILHDLGGETPMSIAVIPEDGVLFVATHKGRQAHIDRMLLDGSMRTHVIESGLVGPIKLHYDAMLNRVLWVDAGSGLIESTSADGDDRHIFKTLTTTPGSIASLNDDIFWTNHYSRHVYWSKSTGMLNSMKATTLDLPPRIETLHLASITPFRVVSHACRRNNGGCSHICFPRDKSAECACPMGMALSSKDNATCLVRTECTSHEFHCGSTDVCIVHTLRCNGFKDCLLGEDEADCIPNSLCPNGYFACGNNGKCIRENLVCDMHFDCHDHSDERNCKEHKPNDCNGFQCDDGECIQNRFVCDEREDCSGGEDERNCGEITCSAEQFRCNSGVCIPKDWECDKEYDCADMSDEHLNCGNFECEVEEFKCDNGNCIDPLMKCNGFNNCGDYSDEMRCALSSISEDGNCNPNEYQCISNSNICLPLSAKCNGSSECPHHEDESDCSDCHVDEFECNNKKCVPRIWLCDGYDDCDDNSDEIICITSNDHSVVGPCENGYRCKSGDGCIDFQFVCNGKTDCNDGSDEGGACNTACAGRTTNPCDQACLRTPSGPICTCHDGFELSGDGQTCRDIVQCNQDPPVCSQLCTEMTGSFICGCHEGFELRLDRVSCKSIDEPMSLYFNVNNEIQVLSEANHSLKVLTAEETPRITGLDVNVLDSTVYYSIEDLGTIHQINTSDGSRLYISQVGRPQKLAVDWLTRNVYFAQSETAAPSIQVCNFERQRCAPLVYLDAHSQVGAIAVDALNKYVFYAVTTWFIFNNPQRVIYRANLDGSAVHEVVKSSPGHISGLALDHRAKVVYFADQHLEVIERIRYDGIERTTIVRNISHPSGLNLFEDHLYFITPLGYMSKCKLFGNVDARTCTAFRLNTYASDLFALAQSSRQPRGINPCANNTCNHLCVANDYGARCLCENGNRVSLDRKEENDGCEAIVAVKGARVGGSEDQKPTFVVKSYGKQGGSSSRSIASIVLMPIFIIFVAFCVYYYYKKRRGYYRFNISMRFNNPIYGVPQPEKPIVLNPGEHEYFNPVETFKTVNNMEENSVLKRQD